MVLAAEAKFCVCHLAPSTNPKCTGKDIDIYKFKHKIGYKSMGETNSLNKSKCRYQTKTYGTIMYKAHT
jgi:hypothetical protein